MFMHRVTNPSGDDNWYGFYRESRAPDEHRSWDKISSVVSFERVHVAFSGDINRILLEFNPAPRQIESLLIRALCCALALEYYGEKGFLNEILVSLEI